MCHIYIYTDAALKALAPSTLWLKNTKRKRNMRLITLFKEPELNFCYFGFIFVFCYLDLLARCVFGSGSVDILLAIFGTAIKL